MYAGVPTMAPLRVGAVAASVPVSPVGRRRAKPKSVILGWKWNDRGVSRGVARARRDGVGWVVTQRSITRQQDIGRLEVAVDDALLVGMMHGAGQRLDQPGRVRGRATARP